MNSNTSDNVRANDGTLHNSQAGARVHDMANSSGQGHHEHTVYDSAANRDSSGAYTSQGNHHNSSGMMSGNTTSSSNTTYMSQDGDLHNSKLGAKADNMTGSNNNTYSSRDDGLQSSRTGMTDSSDYRSTNAGPTSGSFDNSPHGAPGARGSGLDNNRSGTQYMSNDGDMHRTSAGANLDSATNRSGHGTTDSSGLGRSDGFSDQTYDSSRRTGESRPYDSNTVGNDNSSYNTSNDLNSRNTSSTTHHDTSSTHHDEHNKSHKPGMMDKVKGTIDQMTGKMSKDETKAQHGQQVKEGLIDPKSDKHYVA